MTITYSRSSYESFDDFVYSESTIIFFLALSNLNSILKLQQSLFENECVVFVK